MEHLTFSPDVSRARKLSLPVVALESTVITHGLPPPQNLSLARDMEAAVRQQGATPATIALIGGKVRVGLSESEIEDLSRARGAIKVSRRDIAAAVVQKLDGGTTVAGTMHIAHQAGIQVFATGGIGGVHREGRFDISTDLQTLADTPMIVVCAGAKAILDLPRTRERLETLGVPVIGFGCDELPAFYTRSSGLPVDARCDRPDQVAAIWRAHRRLGLQTGMLVTVPVPAEAALDEATATAAIERALAAAAEQGVRGKALTPFLLSHIAASTGEASLRANLALLKNNARLGASIALALLQHE